jgi:DNA-binding transcriptional LysR family regulator
VDLFVTDRLIEVMPAWHFAPLDLSLLYLRNRHISRPVRLFKEFAVRTAPVSFPDLPG